jgi:lactoylglutathione lyase
MYIDHIAIWCNDYKALAAFYSKWFNGKCSDEYFNTKRNFKSVFVSFESACRLELMHIEGIENAVLSNTIGLAHLAFRFSSKDAVNEQTERMKNAGVKCISNPRITGDGYYESCFEDPEGNLIEIVC